MNLFSAKPLRARVAGVLDSLPLVVMDKPTLLPTTPTGVMIVVGPDRVYDSAGRWWQFYLPEGSTPAPGAPLDYGRITLSPTDVVRTNGAPSSSQLVGLGSRRDGIWWNGYIFFDMYGPPTTEGGGFWSVVNHWIENHGAEAVIAILTAINPAVGIASAAVYEGFSELSRGAKLTDAVMGATLAAAQTRSSSLAGSGLVSRGLSLIQNGATPQQIEEATKAAIKLAGGDESLEKAFATGVALGQTQLIQEQAVKKLRSKLTPKKQEVLDTALANGGTLLDASLGLLGDQGASSLNTAIAQSKQAVTEGGGGGVGGGGGGGGRGGPGVVTLGLVAAAGYLGYRALRGRR